MTETNPQGRMIELDELTCRQLLDSHDVGRLAFNADPSPEVLPVNYALSNDSVVFHTGAGAKQAAAAHGQNATFQVDGVHADRRSAWSIMVRGRLEASDDADGIESLPKPLPEGGRPYRVRLRIAEIAGRRIPSEQGWVLPSHTWRGQDASDLMG